MLCDKCFSSKLHLTKTWDDSVVYIDEYTCYDCNNKFKHTRGLEPQYWANMSKLIRNAVRPSIAHRVEFGLEHIRIYQGRYNELVTWTRDEWIEDPDIVISIANATYMAAAGDNIAAMINHAEYIQERNKEVKLNG